MPPSTDDDEHPHHKALDEYLAGVAQQAGQSVKWSAACELLVKSIDKLRATLDKDKRAVELYVEHGLDPRRAARTTLVSAVGAKMDAATYRHAVELLAERGWIECYRINKAKGRADEVYRFMVGDEIRASESVKVPQT